jgi:hypothetical protein
VILNACKDVGLAVNTGKPNSAKYVEITRYRGMMANEHFSVGGNSYEKVKTFKYVGSLLTNRNWLKAGDSYYYYSVQTLLCSRLLSKNLKIKIH